MKHARALSAAVVISVAFTAFFHRAEAALHGAWSGIVHSTAGLPVTRSVSADVRTLQMTVRWQCSEPALCVMTGRQVNAAGGVVIARPPGAVAPAPYFLLTPSFDCVERYGPTARFVGAWVDAAGVPIVTQCFTESLPQRIRPRPDLPPIRLGPISLPPELRNPTGDERPTPRNQLPPGTRPRP